MSVHIIIRIPDELAAKIEERAKSESMTQTAVIVNGLWAALSPVELKVLPISPEAVAELQKAMDAQPQGKLSLKIPREHGRTLARKTAARALGRTPENLSLADNRDARLAHAQGCKCLMCTTKAGR